MRKFLIFIMLQGIFIMLQGQDTTAVSGDDSWVYRVNFNSTNEYVDSVFQYIDVYMDVNGAVLTDSVVLVFMIGTDFGLSDIFLRRQLFSSALMGAEHAGLEPGTYRFNLGRYLVRPETPFIVDLGIEVQDSSEPETEQ